MNMKELNFTRYFGDRERNYAVNLLKTISEAAGGQIAFPPTMIAKVQSAHDTLGLYKKKKATEKQLLDTFATVGLSFFTWITATVNQIDIESVESVREDPLGSLEDVDSQLAAADSAPIDEVKLHPEVPGQASYDHVPTGLTLSVGIGDFSDDFNSDPPKMTFTPDNQQTEFQVSRVFGVKKKQMT